MNGIFIVPTGIGCKIGGHAGDATPAAKVVAECCDNLVVHPNVVNASDINEMTENMLYVEGSILDGFLAGDYGLKKVKQNKILLVVNAPVRGDTTNAVYTAQHTIGAEIEIVELKTPLTMVGNFIGSGRASGVVENYDLLCEQIKDYDFDALAIHTEIIVAKEIAMHYFKNGGVNPWGGVEAKASKLIADIIKKPVAHAPLEREEVFRDKEFMEFYKKPVPIPQTAPEILSVAYLHCVFKGLNEAPRIGYDQKDLYSSDIDFLISPDCWGRPHELANAKGIPIIIVKENTTVSSESKGLYMARLNKKKVYYARTYLDAVGLIMCIKSGVTPKSVAEYAYI